MFQIQKGKTLVIKKNVRYLHDKNGRFILTYLRYL